MLSDMGAEVIKIENPDGGDDTRKGAGPRAGGETGESHFFMTFNRGKKERCARLHQARRPGDRA